MKKNHIVHLDGIDQINNILNARKITRLVEEILRQKQTKLLIEGDLNKLATELLLSCISNSTTTNKRSCSNYR